MFYDTYYEYLNPIVFNIVFLCTLITLIYLTVLMFLRGIEI